MLGWFIFKKNDKKSAFTLFDCKSIKEVKWKQPSKKIPVRLDLLIAQSFMFSLLEFWANSIV